ncbi:uncharacterized protein LOC129272570 [Lytechinus pictus]|uniref:uncharacterized protein LOC129272570 n=1 Tax=Lytechinus pictus TaxID=7653 RepID=UPI0030B9F77D
MLLISGACLPAIGVALTSIATSITQVAICMSITGLGIGNLMVVTNLTLHWVAKENYNLYLSIGLTGYGPGMVLLPLLAEYLRGPYGWRGGLLITSALLANIIPCAVGMTLETREHYTKWNDPKSDYRSLSSDSDGSDCEEGHKHREIGGKSYLLRLYQTVINSYRQSDFFNDKIFNAVLGLDFAFFMVYCCWHSFLIPHALQRGVATKNIIILTLVAAIGNSVSRGGVGVLTNNWFNPLMVFFLATILNIASLLIDAYVTNYYVMVLTSCLSAMSVGGRATASNVILRDRASPDKYDVAYATDKIVAGIGTFLGGYLGGVIADHFSSYSAPFKMLPLIDTVVLVFVVVIRCNPKAESK